MSSVPPPFPWFVETPSRRNRHPDGLRLLSLSPSPVVERCHPRPPLVTIAIPAFKRPDLLRQALLSIAAQETFDDFEVIVSDDLGLPETRDVVAACPLPRIRLFVNPQPLGAVGNWNRCLELAAGRWITILHEDDLLYPWFFRLVLPQLRLGLAAVATKCVQSDRVRPMMRPRITGRVRTYAPAFFLKSAMTPFPGVLFSVALGRDIGGFDQRLGPLADYDFWYRLACAGPVEVVQQTGAFYRVHDSQWTTTAWPEMLRKMHLLRLRITRQQFPDRPKLGRWLARFFTYRAALAYQKRFRDRPAGLNRAKEFRRIAGHAVPSGWVWQLLQRLAPRHAVYSLELPHDPPPPPGKSDSSAPDCPSVTVAVCTHNRADLLRQTLAGIVGQDYPADRLEILVVDNASTDDTAATVAGITDSRFRLRRIFEAQTGLNHARNRALVEARGDIVVFADDDILVETDWIRQLIAPFAHDYREVIGCIGGEVVPIFPQGKPRWISAWHAPLAFRDKAGPLTDTQNPMGANLAIRRSVFLQVGDFASGLDRNGRQLFGGGDREFIQRARTAGWQIWFAPAARVLHQMPANRTTFSYAARHAFDSARSRVFEQILRENARRYLLSRLPANLAKAGAYAVLAAAQFLAGQAGPAKKNAVRSWRSCGYLYEICGYFLGARREDRSQRQAARSEIAPATSVSISSRG